jgi:FG-GAP repeat
MASKPRFSLAACLIPIVLSAVGTAQSDDTPAADAAQAPQPSCATTFLEPNDQEGADGFGYSVAVHGQTALVGIPFFSTAFVTPPCPSTVRQHFTPATLGYVSYASFGGTLAVNGKGQAVIGTPVAYDFGTQTEYGPTFLYTLQGGQFTLTSLLSTEQPPATSMGITNEYVITGYLDEVLNSGAEIWNLNALPTN